MIFLENKFDWMNKYKFIRKIDADTCMLTDIIIYDMRYAD